MTDDEQTLHLAVCIVSVVENILAGIYTTSHSPFSVHKANQTTYFIEDLEPYTSYQFRVIALKQNKSSPFSVWSDVINTTSKHNLNPTVLYSHLPDQ